jgi:fructose-1,6-bisphosphatase/inositol monophosphatase family enzyme
MASRALPKPDRTQAASRIAAMIEEHMEEAKMSEREKNKRVKDFGKRVDQAIRTHARRPK